MTPDEIRTHVSNFVHGKDGKGGLIIPWSHDKYCTWCDDLANFVEGLFNESGVTPRPSELTKETVMAEIYSDPDMYFEGTFKNPLAKDASLPPTDPKRRSETLRSTGLVCNCPKCIEHRIP